MVPVKPISAFRAAICSATSVLSRAWRLKFTSGYFERKPWMSLGR